MQKNPKRHNSYFYHNPAFSHGTSSTQSPLDQEPQYPHEARKGNHDGDDKSLEQPKIKDIEVHTKDGVVHMDIKKPQAPSSIKDRPTVIVKRGNEYEAGTLMYTVYWDLWWEGDYQCADEHTSTK